MFQEKKDTQILEWLSQNSNKYESFREMHVALFYLQFITRVLSNLLHVGTHSGRRCQIIEKIQPKYLPTVFMIKFEDSHFVFKIC